MFSGGFDAGNAGGFVPSQFESGGGSAEKPERRRAPETLMPVTVKILAAACQAASASDEPVRVHGQELHNITIVGKILSLEAGTTSFNYVIADGSGQMEVKQWIDDENADSMMELAKEGRYVRIFGNVRSINGNHIVQSFTIRPVTDFNEITFHNLEVIYVHNFFTKGSQNKLDMSNGVKVAMNLENSFNQSERPSHGAIPMGVAMTSNATECEDMVRKLLEEVGSATPGYPGLTVQAIGSKLPQFNAMQISTAIESLVNDGRVYSSIDDFHFKATST